MLVAPFSMENTIEIFIIFYGIFSKTSYLHRFKQLSIFFVSFIFTN